MILTIKKIVVLLAASVVSISIFAATKNIGNSQAPIMPEKSNFLYAEGGAVTHIIL